MKKLKKFGNAFFVVLCVFGPIAALAIGMSGEKSWTFWPLLAYFITIPAVFATQDLK